MNERKLKIFYEVASELNMTKVAEKLYISQSAISQTIREIEEELDIKLFERIGKKIYLSYEGEIFLKYVRRLLNVYEDSNRAMKELKNFEKGKLKIGASTTIGIYILPNIIGEFVKKYDGVEVPIVIENTFNICKMILENKIDFAFVEGPVYSEEIFVENFCLDKLVFLANKSHPFVKQNIINKDELSKEKLIMREKGSGTRDIFERALNENNVGYNVYLELGHTEAIKKAVEAGIGISCLSFRCIQDELDYNKLKTFKVKDVEITRQLSIIYHKDKYISNLMQVFFDFARCYI